MLPAGHKRREHCANPRPQGLAALSPERRREIAAQGGAAVQASGAGRRWQPEEARQIGRAARQLPPPRRAGPLLQSVLDALPLDEIPAHLWSLSQGDLVLFRGGR